MLHLVEGVLFRSITAFNGVGVGMGVSGQLRAGPAGGLRCKCVGSRGWWLHLCASVADYWQAGNRQCTTLLLGGVQVKATPHFTSA